MHVGSSEYRIAIVVDLGDLGRPDGMGPYGQTVRARRGDGLAVLQVVGFCSVHRSLKHFPTQLRIAYAHGWPRSSSHTVHSIRILTAGTTARVLTGYCAMARLLILLPWNRSVPLTLRRIGIIASHPPVEGSVANGLPL